MLPWEIARLTDHQIENLYRGPQARRCAALERQMSAARDVEGGPGAPDAPVIDRRVPPALAMIGGTANDAAAGIKAVIARGEVPSRESIVTLYRWFGMSAEAAGAKYESDLAKWNAQRKGN
jgi:hypothetical protein